MGDTHREKMPHGPFWNRLNMTGQVILFAALLIAAFRFVSWMAPNSGLGRTSAQLFSGMLSQWSLLGVELNYYHVVDIGIAGSSGCACIFGSADGCGVGLRARWRR